jgi:hypothetical protein
MANSPVHPENATPLTEVTLEGMVKDPDFPSGQ